MNHTTPDLVDASYGPLVCSLTQGAYIDSEGLKRIIPCITKQIFTSIVESNPHLKYLVKVSYMEIYMEQI